MLILTKQEDKESTDKTIQHSNKLFQRLLDEPQGTQELLREDDNTASYKVCQRWNVQERDAQNEEGLTYMGAIKQRE